MSRVCRGCFEPSKTFGLKKSMVPRGSLDARRTPSVEGHPDFGTAPVTQEPIVRSAVYRTPVSQHGSGGLGPIPAPVAQEMEAAAMDGGLPSANPVEAWYHGPSYGNAPASQNLNCDNVSATCQDGFATCTTLRRRRAAGYTVPGLYPAPRLTATHSHLSLQWRMHLDACPRNGH